jgi:hypothetical protein
MREPRRFQWPLLILLIFVLGAAGALAQGQSGNDLPGDALQIQPGQVVSGSISKAGEIDYFVFPMDSSGIVSLTVDGVPVDMKPRITINNEYFGLWISAQKAEKTATNAGDSLTLEKDMQGPGGCYITVSDADGKAHSSPYSLKLDFKPANDPYEPNNLIGEATVVAPNQKVTAYICPADDLDYYLLEINTSGTLFLKVEGVPEDMRPRVVITNEYTGLWTGAAAVADKTATNPGDSLTLEKDLLGSSGYWIAVSDADGKAHADPYSLAFGFEPAPDSNEPNDDVGDATEIKMDQPLTAYISPGSDKDFYKIYMNVPGAVAFEIEVPEDMRPYIEVRDKNNRRIADKSATNPGDSLTLETDLGAGWCYIVVADADGKAHSRTYTLTVTANTETNGRK